MAGTPTFAILAAIAARGQQVKVGLPVPLGQLSALSDADVACWPAWSWIWYSISGAWRTGQRSQPPAQQASPGW